MKARIIFNTLFVIFLLFFISCDPARILVIKAAKKNNASVMIYGNGSIIPQQNANEKILIQIPSKDNEYETTYFYGLGAWGDSTSILHLTNNIDSIIIVNNTNKKILKNKQEIHSFLLKSRHGFAKSILSIEAK